MSSPKTSAQVAPSDISNFTLREKDSYTKSTSMPLFNTVKLQGHQSALLNGPKRWHPAQQKAKKALKAQHYIQAITHLTHVLEIYPNSYSAKCDRAEAYMNINELDKAKEDLTAAITHNPKKSQAWSKRGELFYRRARYDEALVDLAKALKLESKNVY